MIVIFLIIYAQLAVCLKSCSHVKITRFNEIRNEGETFEESPIKAGGMRLQVILLSTLYGLMP